MVLLFQLDMLDLFGKDKKKQKSVTDTLYGVCYYRKLNTC